MNPEARAARDRISAFLACLHAASDTIVTLHALAPPGEPIPLKASDIHAVLAALDQQPAGIIHFPGDMSKEDIDRLHRAWDAANGSGDFLRFARTHTDASTHTKTGTQRMVERYLNPPGMPYGSTPHPQTSDGSSQEGTP